MFLLGDYNVDISPVAKHNLAIEEFKNILSSEHFSPLINKPTRESKHSHTIIDNIYCNIPSSIEMYDSGILRPFISDHNVVFCVCNDKRAYIKRNFCKRAISKFCKFLKNELWNDIYYSGTQEAFTEFQRIINSHFDKSYKKQTFTLTYKNCFPWMTNSLRTKITEKKPGLKIHEIPRQYRTKQTLQKEKKSTYIRIKKLYYMDVKNTILSLKNSSPGYDEFPAFIAKQCIDNYVVPLTYVINMSLMEDIFLLLNSN